MKVKPDTVMAVCYKTIAHGYHGRYDIYLHRIVFMQHTLFAGKIEYVCVYIYIYKIQQKYCNN